MSDAAPRAWVDALGWETMLSRRGATWRRLPEGAKAGLDEAVRLMFAHPTLIKRPVLDLGDGRYHVDFNEADYAALLGRQAHDRHARAR